MPTSPPVSMASEQSASWRPSPPRTRSRWFGVKLAGPFVAGKTITGTFDQDFDPAAIAEHRKRLGLPPSKVRTPEPDAAFCTVERIEPERYFSFRWVPYGIDAEVDPENEPQTLVECRLEPTFADGTLVTIAESGFDRVPAHRRDRAFRMNEGGWTGQAANIKEELRQRHRGRLRMASRDLIPGEGLDDSSESKEHGAR